MLPIQWPSTRRWGMVLGVVLAFWPSFALACTQPAGGHPRYTATEHTNAAAIVLEGTVVGGQPNDSPYILTATVEVTQYFKGVTAGVGEPFVYIDGFGSSAACRAEVKIGDRLIFYVRIGPKGQWEAHYMSAGDAIAQVTPELVTEIIAAVGSPPVAPLPSTPGPLDPTSIPITTPADPATVVVPTPQLPRELPATSQAGLPLIWWVLLGLTCFAGGIWLRWQYLKSRI